jgi:hypothetical protein
MPKTFIYTVRTKSGIKFHIEASDAMEAEQRARHPAIVRELALMLSGALADVDSVEWHRGPVHRLNERLVFRDEIFI